MRIQQVNNYVTPFNGLSSNNASMKSIIFGKQISEFSNKSYQPTCSTRISNHFMSSVIKSDDLKMANEESLKNNEILDRETINLLEEIRMIADKKLEESDNLLSKLGINGKVTGLRTETNPQNYTMYYIESADKNAQNVVLTELENGEFIFGETSLDSETLCRLFDKFRDENGFNNAKFNVDELKNMFIDFLNSHEKIIS